MSAFSLLAIAPAQAVILDFQSLEQNNDIGNNVGTSYTEDGFTVSQPGTQPYALFAFGTQSRSYPGSTALFNNNRDGVTRLTQVGGGAFTLSSIDLADLFNDGSQAPVTFTGLRADSSTTTQSFVTDNLSGLQTFNFSNFTNLVSVDWTQDTFSGHQFDNINVSSSTTTAVPEPFTILGTLFGAGSGFILKRKLAKVQQDKQDIG